MVDAMSNHEITQALSKYPSFIGVFPADINPLPRIRSFPACYIMNTKDRSKRVGGHWLAFYLRNPTSLEFFDSLGLSLSTYVSIANYFSYLSNIKENITPLQLASSALCGDYCVTFLSLRITTNSYPATLQIISSHPKGEARESFVRRLRLLNQK